MKTFGQLQMTVLSIPESQDLLDLTLLLTMISLIFILSRVSMLDTQHLDVGMDPRKLILSQRHVRFL